MGTTGPSNGLAVVMLGALAYIGMALEQARQFYPLVKPDSGQAGMSADQPAPPEEDDEP